MIALAAAGATLALLLPGGASAATVTSTLTIHINGIGTIKGDGINCGQDGSDCTETYPAGTVVTLTAVGTAKSVFGGWTGACWGNGDTCVLGMDEGSKDVNAVFAFIETVSVTVDGNGSGTVESDPQGVTCPWLCAWSYAGDTPVVLTAAAKAGSVFTGWSGACKGTGDCVVHQTYGTISVWAHFVKKGGSSGGGSSGGGGSGGGGSGGNYKPPAGSFAYASGAGAGWTSGGRVIEVRFHTSRAAGVLLRVYHGSKPFSSASVTVGKGTFKVRLPMPKNAPAGSYSVTATLKDAGGATTSLKWSTNLPR